jgi:hypothetical protein
MDDEITRLLEEARALDEIANAGSDELLDRVRRRNAPPRELVYKTHEPQPVQQQDVPTELATKDWVIDGILPIIGEEIAEGDDKLREEIAALRADIAILQGIVRGEVASIKQGKADAA